jgi:hypothetical protein
VALGGAAWTARHDQGFNLGAVARGRGWRFAQLSIRRFLGLVYRVVALSPVVAAPEGGAEESSAGWDSSAGVKYPRQSVLPVARTRVNPVGGGRGRAQSSNIFPHPNRLGGLPAASRQCVEVGALRHCFDTGFDSPRGLASTASTSLARREAQGNRRFDTSLRHFDTASTFLSPTSTHPPLLLEAGASEGSFFQAKRHPLRQTARSASTDAARSSYPFGAR